MPIVEQVRRLARAAIVRTAHDVTDATAKRSALILAPHPDDETLGCGAAIIRKLAANSAVTLAMVTDGRHSHRSSMITPDQLACLRREELRNAAARLGLPATAVRWIGIEDGTVAANEDGLVAIIERMLAELCPDELYATSAEEPHPDHAAVGRAARRAAKSVPRVSVLEYPIWLWGAWPLRPGHRLGSMVEAAGRVFRHRAVTVRTDGIVDAKLHALDAHQTQMRRLAEMPDDEEWIVLPKQVLAAAGDTVELFFPFAQ